MNKHTADAFVYAKAAGLYKKLYIGSRAKKLYEARSLQELWLMLFSQDLPAVSEANLARIMEQNVTQQVVDCFLQLLSLYDTPSSVLINLIARLDYDNLKTVSLALAHGEKEKPALIDLKQFSLFRWKHWPEIGLITAHSPAHWFDRVPEKNERVSAEIRLDQTYYASLWQSLQMLDQRERFACERLIREEIILQNIVWAIRLKVYYELDNDEIASMFACKKDLPNGGVLCKDAFFALHCATDSWHDWQQWRYAFLLNPHQDGKPWQIDPRTVQLSAEKYLFRLAKKEFHRTVGTSGFLIAFFKVKQLEEYMIRVATESLRVGISDSLKQEFGGDDMYV